MLTQAYYVCSTVQIYDVLDRNKKIQNCCEMIEVDTKLASHLRSLLFAIENIYVVLTSNL